MESKMNKVYGAGEGYPSVGAVAGGQAGPAVSSSDNRCLVEWTTMLSVVFVSVTWPLGVTRRPPRTSTYHWLPGLSACKQRTVLRGRVCSAQPTLTPCLTI
jgi:hypothetical protein